MFFELTHAYHIILIHFLIYYIYLIYFHHILLYYIQYYSFLKMIYNLSYIVYNCLNYKWGNISPLGNYK
ncbi:hypothetical protein AMV208 [Betaentomopoxvirus amoorei]|uniref:AMV208 n=1 Tax=Amsacta moorei entomopoxvirus TaxID=28321 RepID=Q9EMJ8_AMEPV|nr:hypothetical protein AMV208 [Amsacta moorei entomopoxvirus]AAG02914.1 AMV208 [Amsacta moorei entomopoxvirus]